MTDTALAPETEHNRLIAAHHAARDHTIAAL